MRSQEYMINLFIDALILGKVTIDLNKAIEKLSELYNVDYLDMTEKPPAEAFADEIRQWQADEYMLRTYPKTGGEDQPSELYTNHEQATSVLYSLLSQGRIEGWIKGEFNELDLDEKVKSLEEQLKKVTEQRDALLVKLTQTVTESPPMSKDFSAMR